MYVNKVESDKNEIVYDVQWKMPGNDDDKTKIIGIASDTNLDWNTFKSYLIQNSGNMRVHNNDIRISYLDSDDDLIPIDSELEFRECLKFSRIRARNGRRIMLKVSLVSNNGAKPKDPTKYADENNTDNKSSKPKPLFCLKKDISDKFLMKKVNVTQMKKDSNPPEWFEKYMTQFKTELVQEITATVMSNVRASLESNNSTNVAAAAAAAALNVNKSRNDLPHNNVMPVKGPHHHHHHHLHHILEKRKKKKKVSEEDSSDCTDGLQLQWEEKLELLRHMQKMKRDKKCEKKLEKLESKTKKIIEKKHSFWTKKKGVGGGNAFDFQTGSNLSGPPLCEFVMDATPIDEFNFVPHVLRGEVITQMWKVMNNGQLSWSEDTELRFAWGSKSLVPLTGVVKCPHLKPSETGWIQVSLQAPLISGNFESYWHFYHQGRRFGHWLGCAVVVEQEIHSQPLEATRSCCIPVDLTMKYPNQSNDITTNAYDNKISTTDDMKIYNNETKPEVIKLQPPQQEEEIKKITSEEPEIELEEYPKLKAYIDVDTIFPDLILRKTETNSADNQDVNPSWPKYGGDVDIELLNVTEDEIENKIDNTTTQIGNVAIEDDGVEKKSPEKDVGEYVSGSDSDNISIISGVDDSDESEPNDEYVVIPMAACVHCDQNAVESLPPIPVTQPITVEIPKSPSSDNSDSSIQSHRIQTSDNNNNMEMKMYPDLSQQQFEPVLVAREAIESKDEKQVEKSSDDENTVYVRDTAGNAIPVAKVLKGHSPSYGFTGVSHSTFGDPNFGHGPNGPRFPFGFGHDAPSPPAHCHNPGGTCNFRPQHESPGCSNVHYSVHMSRAGSGEGFCNHFCQQEPPQQQQQQQQQQRCSFKSGYCSTASQQQQQQQGNVNKSDSNSSGSSFAWTSAYQNIHTEQPRSSKYSYAFTDGNVEDTNKGTSANSKGGNENREPSPVAAAVQILPETLVNGAVNVASSAINTARSVIEMLRPRHDEPHLGQWEQIPSEVEQSLLNLNEMGFKNRELNIMLLTKYNNDVSRVVSELIP